MSEPTLGNDLFDEVMESFVQRLRRGDCPSVGEYTAKYPDLAERIEKLFPAIVVMEKLGSLDGGQPDSNALRPAGATYRIPTQLGEYRVLREVGRGGMGIVFEAVQESLGRHVALKVLPFHGLLNPTHLERFRREARAAARLHHTNIVPVFGVGEHVGIHYYAMQFILGQGLDEVLREVRRIRADGTALATPGEPTVPGIAASVAEGLLSGQFSGSGSKPAVAPHAAPAADALSDTLRPGNNAATGSSANQGSASVANSPERLSSSSEAQYFRGVAQIGLQVAGALEYAHEQGVLHRDIKPSNLLLDTAGRVWVTDFGLAKAEDSDELTSPGDIVGTVTYMAPERFAGEADERSDVYGLGATLYEMLTLRPAFLDKNRGRLIERVTREEPYQPSTIDRHIPRDLETIVLKAITKEPARRYQTAVELAEDLRRFLADRPIRSRRTSAFEKTWRWCRRNPAVAVTSALAAGALVAALVLSLALAIHQHNAAENLRAALEQAQIQRGLADQATGQLRAEQEQTKAAFDEAQSQKRLAERLSTTYAMHQGLNLCDQGDVGLGLLWLAQSLRIAPDHAPDLQHVVRANLGAWKPQCRPLKALLQHGDAVIAIAYSRDGNRLLTGSWDTGARIWTTDGALLGPVFWHGSTVDDVDLSLDGRFALASGPIGAQLWEVATGKPVGRRCGGNIVKAAVLNPADETIVTIDKEGNLKRWDGHTGEARGDIGSIAAWPYALAMSPDGATLLTGDADRTARLWDAVTGRRKIPPILHTARVRCVAFDARGARFITGTLDGTAQVWDAHTGKPLGPPLPHGGEIRAVSFSRDGAEILTGSTNGTAQRWNAHTFRRLGPPLRCRGQVFCAAFSPDRRAVATGGTENVAQLWDISGPATAEESVLRHDYWVRAVAVSRDGRQVLTGSDDCTAQLWDAKSGAPVGPRLQHPWPKARVRAVAIGADGKLLLTGSLDGCARLWEAANGRLVAELKCADEIWVVAFSPDGKRFLTGDAHGRIQSWDAVNRQRIDPFFQHPAKVNALAYSPDGRVIVSGGQDKTVRRWLAQTGQPLGESLQHGDAVWAVAFSPDGRHLVTGSWDGTARFWDTATGNALGAPFPHHAKVEAVAFSPDGKTVVTAGLDEAARLWDVATRQPIGPPMKHDNIVLSVAFFPDGKRLITGSADNAAHVWSVPPPLDGSAEEIMDSMELLTGMRLEAGGAAVAVDAKAWSERSVRRLVR
jgi:WD40 repeat protein/serine/threonine protein kinase